MTTPTFSKFRIKILLLIALVTAAMVITQIVLATLAYSYGLEIGENAEIKDLISVFSDKMDVKWIIAFNHILLFTVVPVVFVAIMYKPFTIKYFSLHHFDARYLMLFPLALYSLYPLLGSLSMMISKWPLPQFLSQMDENALESLQSLLQMNSIIDLLLNILVVGIIAGIGEELLFRGVIQKEILNRFGNPHVAIWVTAIIFSAFHFQIIGFLPKLMIGVLLGYAYFLSGSLILPMIIHALNNSLATVMLYLSKSKIEMPDTETQEIPWNVTIVSSLIAIFIIYQIFNLSPNKSMEHE